MPLIGQGSEALLQRRGNQPGTSYGLKHQLIEQSAALLIVERNAK
jgi:hypothetical protein